MNIPKDILDNWETMNEHMQSELMRINNEIIELYRKVYEHNQKLKNLHFVSVVDGDAEGFEVKRGG